MRHFKKRPGSVTTVIFSNEEINDTIKVVKSLEDSNILLKEVIETLKNDGGKVVL